jgi:hypothetical protein
MGYSLVIKNPWVGLWAFMVALMGRVWLSLLSWVGSGYPLLSWVGSGYPLLSWVGSGYPLLSWVGSGSHAGRVWLSFILMGIGSGSHG